MKKVNVYIWPDKPAWNKEKADKLVSAFKPLSAKVDKRAAIGAGADGLLPALNILFDFFNTHMGQLLITGFVGAIGGNVWDLLKKGLLKAVKVKPKPQDLSVYGLKESKGYAELIWYLRFSNKKILITIVIKEGTDFEKALDKLPQAIDEAIKSDKEFGRIYWFDSKWKAL